VFVSSLTTYFLLCVSSILLLPLRRTSRLGFPSSARFFAPFSAPFLVLLSLLLPALRFVVLFPCFLLLSASSAGSSCLSSSKAAVAGRQPWIEHQIEELASALIADWISRLPEFALTHGSGRWRHAPSASGMPPVGVKKLNQRMATFCLLILRPGPKFARLGPKFSVRFYVALLARKLSVEVNSRDFGIANNETNKVAISGRGWGTHTT